MKKLNYGQLCKMNEPRWNTNASISTEYGVVVKGIDSDYVLFGAIDRKTQQRAADFWDLSVLDISDFSNLQLETASGECEYDVYEYSLPEMWGKSSILSSKSAIQSHRTGEVIDGVLKNIDGENFIIITDFRPSTEVSITNNLQLSSDEYELEESLFQGI